MSSDVIYLDYNASTPAAPEVVEAMLPYFTEKFANAASFTHAPGRIADAAVDKARAQVAAVINAEAKDIIFTSGATESINLSIQGVTGFFGAEKNHIITTAIEHKAVLECCKYLKESGYEQTILPVNSQGQIDPAELEAALTPKTALVSVQHANNEIGTVQDLKVVGEICRSKGVFLHVDAAQSFGKLPIDVEEMKIDLLSISGHKIYGPKGTGALYVRRRNPRVRLKPMLLGGGHEREFRAGTINVPGIVGLGKAAEVAQQNMDACRKKADKLAETAVAILKSQIDDVCFNGDYRTGLPGTLSVTIPGVEARGLLCELPTLALSTGSACSSAMLKPSHVLKAIGLTSAEAYATIRIGIGRPTTEEEVRRACELIVEKVNELRQKSEVNL